MWEVQKGKQLIVEDGGEVNVDEALLIGPG